MKLRKIIALSFALVLTASIAQAGFPKISTGNSVFNSVANKAVSTVKNKAIADNINKSIKGIACDFKDTATTTEFKQGRCLDQIIDKINSKKSALETLGLANVYVQIKAHGDNKTAYKRSSHVRDVMYGRMNYWRYTVNSVQDGSNDLEIWVEVKD